MKKIIILTSLIVSASIVRAQSLTEIFDEVFQNVSRADATTGILYERVLPFAGLYNFNSNISPVDTSNKEHFMQHNKLSYNSFKTKI